MDNRSPLSVDKLMLDLQSVGSPRPSMGYCALNYYYCYYYYYYYYYYYVQLVCLHI